jgi:hypothetical protein
MHAVVDATRRTRHADPARLRAPVGARISIESERRSDGLKAAKRL